MINMGSKSAICVFLAWCVRAASLTSLEESADNVQLVVTLTAPEGRVADIKTQLELRIANRGDKSIGIFIPGRQDLTTIMPLPEGWVASSSVEPQNGIVMSIDRGIVLSPGRDIKIPISFAELFSRTKNGPTQLTFDLKLYRIDGKVPMTFRIRCEMNVQLRAVMPAHSATPLKEHDPIPGPQRAVPELSTPVSDTHIVPKNDWIDSGAARPREREVCVTLLAVGFSLVCAFAFWRWRMRGRRV